MVSKLDHSGFPDKAPPATCWCPERVRRRTLDRTVSMSPKCQKPAWRAANLSVSRWGHMVPLRSRRHAPG